MRAYLHNEDTAGPALPVDSAKTAMPVNDYEYGVRPQTKKKKKKSTAGLTLQKRPCRMTTSTETALPVGSREKSTGEEIRP